MNRLSITLLVIITLAPSLASGGIVLTENFESPVAGFSWTTTARSEYDYNSTMSGGIQSSTLLGPISSPTLDLLLLDIFVSARPYAISFDLILLDSIPPTEFSITSNGQEIVSAGDLSAAVLTGFVLAGGGIYHFESLLSPGPTPMGGSGSCCGDIQVQWSLPGGGSWGIDNFVVSDVPEPNTAILFGLGLILLVRRRDRVGQSYGSADSPLPSSWISQG